MVEGEAMRPTDRLFSVVEALRHIPGRFPRRRDYSRKGFLFHTHLHETEEAGTSIDTITTCITEFAGDRVFPDPEDAYQMKLLRYPITLSTYQPNDEVLFSRLEEVQGNLHDWCTKFPREGSACCTIKDTANDLSQLAHDILNFTVRGKHIYPPSPDGRSLMKSQRKIQ